MKKLYIVKSDKVYVTKKSEKFGTRHIQISLKENELLKINVKYSKYLGMNIHKHEFTLTDESKFGKEAQVIKHVIKTKNENGEFEYIENKIDINKAIKLLADSGIKEQEKKASSFFMDVQKELDGGN